jgi:hypothetical protein
MEGTQRLNHDGSRQAVTGGGSIRVRAHLASSQCRLPFPLMLRRLHGAETGGTGSNLQERLDALLAEMANATIDDLRGDGACTGAATAAIDEPLTLFSRERLGQDAYDLGDGGNAMPATMLDRSTYDALMASLSASGDSAAGAAATGAKRKRPDGTPKHFPVVSGINGGTRRVMVARAAAEPTVGSTAAPAVPTRLQLLVVRAVTAPLPSIPAAGLPSASGSTGAASGASTDEVR